MSTEEQPGIKLPMFTEVYGENRERERSVWINPAAVSHVVEYVPWHSSERRTLVHLTNGDTLQLSEGPIYVVTVLQLGRTNVSADSLGIDPTYEAAVADLNPTFGASQ